jgi:hypothetical protein
MTPSHPLCSIFTQVMPTKQQSRFFVLFVSTCFTFELHQWCTSERLSSQVIRKWNRNECTFVFISQIWCFEMYFIKLVIYPQLSFLEAAWKNSSQEIILWLFLHDFWTKCLISKESTEKANPIICTVLAYFWNFGNKI